MLNAQADMLRVLRVLRLPCEIHSNDERSVFYRGVENNWISIYAVTHMSRHPEYWKKEI